MRNAMTTRSLAAALVLGLAAGGCAHTKQLRAQVATQQEELDAARAENEDMKTQLVRARAEIKELEEDLERARRTAVRATPAQPPLVALPSAAPPPSADRELLALDGDMFPPGRATLTPTAKREIRSALPQLRHAAAEGYLRIEGHTDNTPVRAAKDRFPTNFHLAAFRAIAVLDYLTTTGKLDPAKLHIASYGPGRPVTSNATPTGRAHNRRVVVVATPR